MSLAKLELARNRMKAVKRFRWTDMSSKHLEKHEDLSRDSVK